MTIDVEDIYFLIGLSWRGIPVVLTSPKGGEMLVEDIMDEYFVVGTRSQGGKNLIKNIVYQPIRTIAFMIEKVASNRVSL